MASSSLMESGSGVKTASAKGMRAFSLQTIIATARFGQELGEVPHVDALDYLHWVTSSKDATLKETSLIDDSFNHIKLI